MATSFHVIGSYAAGSAPFSVTTADLNGDGLPDIIVANQGDDTVDTFINDGNGSFAPAVSHAAGSTPWDVTTADLGNGRPDIIVADQQSNTIDVLSNEGGGSFAPAVSYAVGFSPLSVTTADLLGNGRQDIVATTENGVLSVLMNQGGGSFAAATTLSAGYDNTTVTTADLDGDGRPDIVVADFDGGVEVLMNQGGGSFAPAVTYAAGADNRFVTTADLLGNGRQDIIVANDYGNVDVLMNQGGGSFAAAVTYAVAGSPYSVTTADLGNGRPDIVVAAESGGVEVLMNQGGGSFAPAVSFAVGAYTGSVTTADLRGDGHQEIIAANQGGVAVLASGPGIASATPAAVEQGQTTVLGAVSPDQSGDTLSVTANSLIAGTLSLGAVQSDGTQQVIYTAPASIPVSVTDSVSYTVTDSDGTSSTSTAQAVVLDGGPTIAAGTPSVVEQGQNTVIGTVTPGIAGDTLSITQAAGALGAVSLGAVQSDGTQQVIYTAPDAVAASGTDNVSYSVADQHGVAVAISATSVTLDAGPAITAATPNVVEQTQTTVIGTVAPGEAGDALSVTQAAGGLGTVSLGAVQSDGSQQVIYTAPYSVPQSVIDDVGYSITDQHGGAVATGSASVQLDAGPLITASTPSTIEAGQTTMIGTAAPGLSGDALQVTGFAGSGSVTLGPVQADGTQQILYTAPQNVDASGVNGIGYNITDQHDDVTAPGSANILVDRGPQVTSQPGGTLEQGQQQTIGSVSPGGASDTLTLTQDPGSTGTVSLGPVQDDGTRSILYTAPASVPATGLDSVVYTVTDQLGGTDSGSALLVLDSGPALAEAAPDPVEQGQQAVLGTVTPGEHGDTLTLTQAAGGLGTVRLGAVQSDGTQQVIYTAPDAVAASGTDNVAYSVADQHGGAVANGSAAVQLDAGPAIAVATPSMVEQGQTTILGTVTPGVAGDTLSVSADARGTVSLGPVRSDGTQQVIYTAPANVPVSGSDGVSYGIVDQHNAAVATASTNVILDRGPSVEAFTPRAVEQHQSTVIGDVRPGEPGDTLSVTQAPGALGTVSLGVVQFNGTQQVIYTAPASVAASGTDTVSYAITDQLGGVVASQSASVTLDAGPAVVAIAAAVEQGQSAVIGTVTPGIAGDTLSLTQAVGALGTVALGAVQTDGTQQVIYTAPAAISTSGPDTVSYSVTDQHGDVVTAQTTAVTLDAGPAIVAAQPAVIEQGMTTVLGTVSPGIAGDTLSVSQAPGALGAVSLGAVQADGTQQVIYTAPANLTADATDTVSYSITDQHNLVVATDSASISLDMGPTITPVTPAVVEGQSVVLGTVKPGLTGDVLSISASPGMFGTVSLGAVQSDGSQQIIYTPPGDVQGSRVANFTYTITDQHNAASASQTASVTLDGGPMISPQTPNVLEQGQTTVLATVAPGEPGDTLTLRQNGSAPGSLTLGAVQSDGTRQVIYTAPASIAATGTAAISYTVSDQHGAVQSAASAEVTLAITPFTGLIVAAADANATLSVSLTLDGSSGGSFVDLGAGSLSTDGSTYSVSGTAAQVNAALHGLGFTSATAGVTAPTFQASLSAGSAATLYGVAGADRITGTASGLALVGSSPGAVVTAPASGGDILVAGSAGETLDGSGASSGDVFFGAADGSVFKGGAGHDTFVLGGGSNTVTSGAGGSVVFLGSGANLVQSQGADTIVGSTGNDTIDAGAGGVVLFAGSGTTSFIGDAARSTVIGGAGALTVTGGAGGGAFYGSAAGNNVLQSGTGNAFLVGAGNGDQLIATGTASNILVAGMGNETLNASGSAGADLLYGGSGADAITLGSGADTLLSGSGSASVTVGAGSAMVDFVAGHGGGVMSMTGFNAGKDHLALFGYGSGEAGQVLQTASVSGGNTTLALSDGTHITLVGVTSLGSQSIV